MIIHFLCFQREQVLRKKFKIFFFMNFLVMIGFTLWYNIITPTNDTASIFEFFIGLIARVTQLIMVFSTSHFLMLYFQKVHNK